MYAQGNRSMKKQENSEVGKRENAPQAPFPSSGMRSMGTDTADDKT